MVGLPAVVRVPWYRANIAACSDIHTKHKNANVWAERRIFLVLNVVVYHESIRV